MRPSEETDKNIGPIWRELYGGLWHTTHPERFLGILENGAILPEPKIPDADRWGTSQGQEHFPYARFIGGLSLFDFHEFDSEAYQARYPASSWRAFVPYRRVWRGAVWIEIDRAQMSADFVSGTSLLDRLKTGGDLAHNIMPIIEAAYLNRLPLAAMKRALFVCEGSDQYHELAITGFDHKAYNALLEEWRAVCRKPPEDLYK